VALLHEEALCTLIGALNPATYNFPGDISNNRHHAAPLTDKAEKASQKFIVSLPASRSVTRQPMGSQQQQAISNDPAH